jgi:hypothetical protein
LRDTLLALIGAGVMAYQDLIAEKVSESIPRRREKANAHNGS